MGGSLSDECGRGGTPEGQGGFLDGFGAHDGSSLWESDSEVSLAPSDHSSKPRGVGACTGAAVGGAAAGCTSRRARRRGGGAFSSSDEEEEDVAAEYAARIDRWLEDEARNQTASEIAGAPLPALSFHGDQGLGHLCREEHSSFRPEGQRPQNWGDRVEASEVSRSLPFMRGLDAPTLFLPKSESSLPIAAPVFVFSNVQIQHKLADPTVAVQRSRSHLQFQHESPDPTAAMHKSSSHVQIQDESVEPAFSLDVSGSQDQIQHESADPVVPVHRSRRHFLAHESAMHRSVSPKSSTSRVRSIEDRPNMTPSFSAVAGCQALGREATDRPGTGSCTSYRWREETNVDSSADEMDPETVLATRIDQSLAADSVGQFSSPGIAAQVPPRVVRFVEPVDSDPASVRFRQQEAASLRPEGRRMPPDFDDEEVARSRQNLRYVPRPFTRRDPPPNALSVETRDLQGLRCEERPSEFSPTVPKSAPANLVGVKHLPVVSGLGGMQRLDRTTKTLSLGSLPGGVNGNAAAQSFVGIEHAAVPVSWPPR